MHNYVADLVSHNIIKTARKQTSLRQIMYNYVVDLIKK